ncbi:MAG: LPS assembly lipoprotein LptE [Pseudomonadota bacterium]
MSLFNSSHRLLFSWKAVVAVVMCMALAGCQFQPLYGNSSASLASGGLSTVAVSQAYSRVGQQVRNHMLFLFNGGSRTGEATHEARIRVSYNNKLLASIVDQQDSTSGTVTVTVTYDLVELQTGDAIATGTRKAIASYDRTGQVFANERAERDAENRAAREVAEALRFAIASDLSRQSS